MTTRLLKSLACMTLLTLLLAPAAYAQIITQIIDAQHAHFETLRAEDARAHIAQHAPDATSFDAVGGLLVEAQSLEEQVRDLQAVFDAGTSLDIYLRHVQVRIYGDAAVVTGYITGTTTNPDGSVVQTMNRRTAVLIRQGGEWKEVHSHASPVVGAQVGRDVRSEIGFIEANRLISPADSEDWTISLRGVGPIHIGLRVDEALPQLPNYTWVGEEHPQLVPDGMPGLTFVVYDWTIIGAQIEAGSLLRTPGGIGIGSSTDDIVRAYGSAIRRNDDYYGKLAYIMTDPYIMTDQSISPEDWGSELVFYISNNRVTTISVLALY